MAVKAEHQGHEVEAELVAIGQRLKVLVDKGAWQCTGMLSVVDALKAIRFCVFPSNVLAWFVCT